jgi:hypothetical protein
VRTVPILIAALVAATLAPAANAHLIRADNWIDDFAVKRDGSLRGAIRALGDPGRIVSISGITCRVSWRRPGIAWASTASAGLTRAGPATAASVTPSRAARDGAPKQGSTSVIPSRASELFIPTPASARAGSTVRDGGSW